MDTSEETNDSVFEDFGAEVQRFGADFTRLTEQLGRVIVGQQDVIEQVLTAMFAGGHVLLEGVPGLGKTLLVRTLAETLDLSFRRIQFTPDLMPADITGTSIVVADATGARSFEFQPGPVFAHLVLADEINRATPKTQSAVLEAMQERTVSIAGQTRPLAESFMVLATQNPIEMEGTYPLPEAQLDRFLMKILVPSPSVDELVTIMARTTAAEVPVPEATLDAARIEQMKRTVRHVAAASDIQRYVARLITATHPDSELAPETVRRHVRYGASPRGAQAVLLAGKVRALRAGRANVSFGDVRACAPAAMRHRLILSFEGQAEGVTTDDVLRTVLRETKPE